MKSENIQHSLKVLVVCSGNSGQCEFRFENDQPFIYEQTESLEKLGIDFDYYFIVGKGIYGYLKNLMSFKKKIASHKYDLVHAYYGHSGALAVLQRATPVVTTFLGCDINVPAQRIFSRFVIKLSEYSIFVSQKLAEKAKVKKNFNIIPFGVDYKNSFFPLDKLECRKKLNMNAQEKIALFASSENRIEKNFSLAKKAADLVGGVKLVQLEQDYKRSDVNLLMNASDLLLLTSIREGSPQVVKEAMACNCPIVSSDVGDVRDVIGSTEGCFITSFDPEDVAEKIRLALKFGRRTNGRDAVKDLHIEYIAEKVRDVYETVLSNR